MWTSEQTFILNLDGLQANEAPEVPWDKLSNDINYIAKDRDGEWWFFDKKPSLVDDIWKEEEYTETYDEDEVEFFFNLEDFTKSLRTWDVPWEESLLRRDDGTENPTKHPHAEDMLTYAQDALTNSAPWELWQWRISLYSEWVDCTSNPTWCTKILYRRKPKTTMIGDVEVPLPYKGDMALDMIYFTPTLDDAEKDFVAHEWEGALEDWNRMNGNLVHLYPRNAIQHSNALRILLEDIA